MIVVTVIPLILNQYGIPFGSKSKGKLSPRSYPIQFERKWKYCFLSVTAFMTSNISAFFSFAASWASMLRLSLGGFSYAMTFDNIIGRKEGLFDVCCRPNVLRLRYNSHCL